jgi:hypothetical protein
VPGVSSFGESCELVATFHPIHAFRVRPDATYPPLTATRSMASKMLASLTGQRGRQVRRRPAAEALGDGRERGPRRPLSPAP